MIAFRCVIDTQKSCRVPPRIILRVYSNAECASLLQHGVFPAMFQLRPCHVRYCLVNSAGDVDIRTCKSSSLLGIGNITRYSQQIRNVKSSGVNFD